MRFLKRALISVALFMCIEAAIGRGLQIAAERYLFTPIAEAGSALAPAAVPRTLLEIVYREGDGSEFVVHCAPGPDQVTPQTLFSEDQASFERLRSAYCGRDA